MTTSRRQNFSRPTRKLLAANANNICTLYDCPNSTISPVIELSGDKASRGVAVAAHINAASPNGPRPTKDMTPAEIKSESNGIWLCPGCARKVDDFAIFYPAELLLEMKRVREHAQQLTLLHPVIAFIGNSIGIKRLDKIVRDHLPDMPADKISQDAKLLYAKWVKFEVQYEPIAQLVPLPENELSAALAKIKSNAVPHPSLSDYHWQEIITSWEKIFLPQKQDPTPNTARSGKGLARITVRHPVTGELALDFIAVRPFVMHTTGASPGTRYDATIHLRHTATPLNPLNWELSVRPQDGIYVVYSELTSFKDLNILKATGPQVRQDFEAYSSVLTKLVDGWKPVGFVGLEVQESTSLNQLHPMPVSIANLIPPEVLNQLKSTASRVQIGYDLEDAWGVSFVFTPQFLHLKLSNEDIFDRASTFLESQGLTNATVAGDLSKPIEVGVNAELFFVLKNNSLAIRSTANAR